MQVDRSKPGMKIPGPFEGCPPLTGAGGPDAYHQFPTGQPVAGREEIVRERLSTLWAALGDLPNDPPPGGAEWRPALRRFLDGSCPPEVSVMHGRRLPHRPLVLEHLLVAPRGLVVVGPNFGQVLRGGHSPRLASGRAREVASRLNKPFGAGQALPGDRRPALVRETLRRSYALRSWLGASPWEGVPVLAAVCSCPAARAPGQPWVMLDGLWLGAADQLPPWLVSEDVLCPDGRAQLGRFLAEALPVA
jgi:hypothetical protein